MFAVAIALLVLATTIVWLAISGNIKLGSNNCSDFLKTIGAPMIAIAILGPLAIWIHRPHETAHKPKEKEIAKGISWNRAKKTGGVVGTVVIVVLIIWYTYTPVVEWVKSHKDPPSPADAGSSTPRSAKERSAMTSRVTSRTIIAPTDRFSEFVVIPPNHKYWGDTRDCVEIKNGRGDTYHYCHGEKLDLGANETMMAFRSPTSKEVEVIVEWEPK